MHLPSQEKAKVRTEEKTLYERIQEEKSNLFQGKKYFLKTYGCQMNVHDSEQIAKLVENLGYQETSHLDEADLVILNTCAIRENAHDKVFGYLGRVKHLKQEKENVILAFCGCMAQEEGVIERILKQYPYIDIVFGTHNIHEFPTMLLKKTKERQIEVYSIEGKVYEGLSYKRDSKYKAWVDIQYGCDKFCTYCIVPYTRGKQRSRKPEEIVKEVESLVAEGYLEVTLLGQNVNAYGKDLEPKVSFAELLKQVAKTNIKRIRFVTSHPWDFTTEMIDVIASYKNIMPYIHLPLQSGSSKILKAMGRRYTKEEYLQLAHTLKEKIPNLALTTDIIVGFPRETEEDFLETLQVVKEVKFDGAYTFIYSPREKTPAAKMDNQIEETVKEERLARLNEVVNAYSLENNKKYVGKTVDVLVEGISEKDSNKVFGYTETMKLVNISGKKDCIGKIVSVRITDAKSFSLDGELVEVVC